MRIKISFTLNDKQLHIAHTTKHKRDRTEKLKLLRIMTNRMNINIVICYLFGLHYNYD